MASPQDDETLMSIKIVPFDEDHLEDAASMVSARYRAERKLAQHLPARFENSESVAPLLQNLARGAPGVVAVQDGVMVGFLVAYVSVFRGVRTTYSPDLGHAADATGRRDIYRRMYGDLARLWLAHGCFTHAITFFAHEQAAMDAWFSVGFGLNVVDALRGLDAAETSEAVVEIRRVAAEDVDVVTPLMMSLRRHLAGSPVFLPLIIEERRDELAEWLSDPANALWLAFQDGEPVGLIRMEPSEFQVLPVSEKSTVAITGAFTKQEVRGQGIGTALLNHGLNWARSAGYRQCSVDFESMNIPSSWFWLGKGFEPVCYSLIRRVDERLGWAHDGRNAGDVLDAYEGRTGAG
jgi:GNAT superfamily N-acetyltransferase